LDATLTLRLKLVNKSRLQTDNTALVTKDADIVIRSSMFCERSRGTDADTGPAVSASVPQLLTA